MPTGHANRLLPALKRVVLVRQTADRTDGQLLGAFVADRDPDAFAGLVRRHGPMVFGVCRRVVGDHATAEDAFQAVFLVLARRAATVKPREQVGNWLYGVAYRTAMKARTVQARRRSREKQVDAMPEPPAPPTPEDVWSDLRPVIDEELARLPDKLRLPVVLCDLEGRPQREVARSLGVPPATLATRLASARRLLADRLTRRGVALSGGALAGVLAGNAAAHAVPRALADGVVRAAEQIAAGVGTLGTTGTLVSAHAVQLSEGVMRMMLVAKLKVVGAAALTVLALAGGVGFGLVPARAGDGPGAGPGTAVIVLKAQPQPPAAPAGATLRARLVADPGIDDATYLNRLCLDLVGVPATPLEHRYFAADPDAQKRAKVRDWLLAGQAVKEFLGKRLGIPAERIQAVRVKLAADGTVAELHVETARPQGWTGTSIPSGEPLTVDVHEIRTGELSGIFVGSDAGLTGNIILNARNFDVLAAPATPNTPKAKVEGGNPASTGSIIWTVEKGNHAGKILVWNPQTLAFSPDGVLLEATDGVQKFELELDLAQSDAAFLRRVLQEARGTPPTALEERYFGADKDPKKREKLLDLLLKNPATAKKLGQDWKKRMLAPPAAATRATVFRVRIADNLIIVPDRLEKLVTELLGAKKTDEQVLEAVTLATLGRLPTAEEKRATLAVIGTAKDRKAAWVELGKALAASDEGKKKSQSPPPKP